MKKQMKEKNGITLIALVITIIVLLILAGVTIVTLTGDNGLLTKAGEAKNTSEKEEIREQIKLSYNEWKLQKETGETLELKDIVETNLNKKYDEVNVNKQGKAISIKVKNHEFTLVDDGTMEEGQLAYLDIAEGNIDLYSNGYKQYTGSVQAINKNNVTEYTGKYIITGTTTEHVVRVCDIGSYDITIKDLNIDVKDSKLSAINANGGGKATGCFVNILLEGNNYLQSGEGPGIGFAGATPNVDGVTNGSTLTIQGIGSVEARGCGNGYAASGIGSSYGGDARGNVSNIIINSGNITAIGKGNACGIGGALRHNVNNIIINDGNIYANSSTRSWCGNRFK